MKISSFFNKVKEITISVEFSILLIVIIGSSWSLALPGLGLGHDHNHEARIFEMAKGIADGNFPVIWSQNFAYGYGMPLFQFYAPLPYFIGALFHLLGLGLGESVKIIILLAHFLTITGGYLLAKELFKDKYAGLISAILIGLAPYRAVNLSVRFAISEGWATAFIPFIILGFLYLAKNKKGGQILLSISLAGLFLSHNITTLLAIPFLTITCLILLLAYYTNFTSFIKKAVKVFASGLIGIGLSAFYSFPAIFEKGFTKLDILVVNNFYSYHQHFLYIRQFFKPWGAWEFGGSGWGPNDEMSFFLGFSQIFVLVIAIIVAIISFIKSIKKKSFNKEIVLHISILFLLIISTSLTLLKFEFVWNLFSVAKYVQFPWRLLSLALIFGGLVGASTYRLIPEKFRFVFFTIILVSTIGINSRYFQSEKYYSHNQEYKNYESYIQHHKSKDLYDYLPKDLTFFEKVGFYLYKNPAFTQIEAPPKSLIKNQDLEVDILKNTSTIKRLKIRSKEPEIVTLNLSYYPNWEIKINNSITESFSNVNGLTSFSIKEGDNEIEIRLKNTAIRNISNSISLVSLILLFIISLHHAKTQPTRPTRHRNKRS